MNESCGFQSGESRPTASSGQVIWCGKSQVSTSMYASATSAAAKANIPTAVQVGPSCRTMATASTAVSSSTSG